MARGSGRRLENGLGGPCPCLGLKHNTVSSSMDQEQCFISSRVGPFWRNTRATCSHATFAMLRSQRDVIGLGLSR